MFYLWWVGHVLKCCKFQKYNKKGCQINFFLRSKITMITQFSGKNTHSTLKVGAIKSFITNKGETIFKSIFWYKSNIQNSANMQNEAT